jgi:hypothetical protein
MKSERSKCGILDKNQPSSEFRIDDKFTPQLCYHFARQRDSSDRYDPQRRCSVDELAGANSSIEAKVGEEALEMPHQHVLSEDD